MIFKILMKFLFYTVIKIIIYHLIKITQRTKIKLIIIKILQRYFIFCTSIYFTWW